MLGGKWRSTELEKTNLYKLFAGIVKLGDFGQSDFTFKSLLQCPLIYAVIGKKTVLFEPNLI